MGSTSSSRPASTLYVCSSQQLLINARIKFLVKAIFLDVPVTRLIYCKNSEVGSTPYYTKVVVYHGLVSPFVSIVNYTVVHWIDT
jgi:hypothetical protein